MLLVLGFYIVVVVAGRGTQVSNVEWKNGCTVGIEQLHSTGDFASFGMIKLLRDRV